MIGHRPVGRLPRADGTWKPVNSAKQSSMLKKRGRLLAECGPICALCLTSFPPQRLNIDHIIPRVRGGSNEYENLQLTCLPCNTEKGYMLPGEYKAFKAGAPKPKLLVPAMAAQTATESPYGVGW